MLWGLEIFNHDVNVVLMLLLELVDHRQWRELVGQRLLGAQQFDVIYRGVFALRNVVTCCLRNELENRDCLL